MIVHRGLLIGCLALGACAAENVGSESQMALAGAPSASEVGPSTCQMAASSAAEGFCRQDWACPDLGLRSVICGQTEEGALCICSDQERAEKQFVPFSLACDTPGGNLEWLAECGWSAP
jgi:hypothetical protein